MANQKHLDILRQGAYIWNDWKRKNLTKIDWPDLSSADLSGTSLSGADLYWADFQGANLARADLSYADLHEADFRRANLTGTDFKRANASNAVFSFASLSKANFYGTNLSNANFGDADLHEVTLRHSDLRKATFTRANLSRADLSGAKLSQAYFRNANFSGTILEYANLADTFLSGARLEGCHVYGISVWNAKLDGAIQSNLIISRYDEPTITVDNLMVAQFIHTLLSNENIRDVLTTITYKVVLILGRFTPERKKILDALRDELRNNNYSPVVFDFEKPINRDFTETVRILAHLSRFIIADLTDPSSIPQELQAIIPDLEVPVQPLLEESKREFAMFADFGKYPWVLPLYIYKDKISLLASLKEFIVNPAEEKAKQIARDKEKRSEKS